MRILKEYNKISNSIKMEDQYTACINGGLMIILLYEC